MARATTEDAIDSGILTRRIRRCFPLRNRDIGLAV